MRPFPSPRTAEQLALFRPARSCPQWAQLPREIRQQSVRLLARLLREHWARTHCAQTAAEVDDE
jgi:hypothetical protein